MMDRHISAEHLLLALVARKAVPDRRWAALSNGAHTNSCSDRGGHYRLPTPPLLSPMECGRLAAVVERTRLHHGLAEVRRVWGKGLRAMRAEAAQVVLRPYASGVLPNTASLTVAPLRSQYSRQPARLPVGIQAGR